MHFSVFSFPSAAVRIAVLVLPLLLLCVTTDVAARQIDARSIAVSASINDNSSAPIFGIAVSDSPVIKKLPEVPGATVDVITEVSYGVTDSPTGNDVPESETTFATVDGLAKLDVTSNYENDLASSQWIQKVPYKNPSAKSSKSLNDPENEVSALKSLGNPLSLSQVLANIIYGPTWSAIDTNSKCSEDMRIYNLHMKNYTMWAAKSKYILLFLVYTMGNKIFNLTCL